MGVEVKLIKSYMKKGTIVLGIGVCLYFLYRFLPSFFVYRFLPSVVNSLASSLPVVFCTALLLGALLTFGQPNGPAQGEKRPPVVSSVRTRRCTSGILAVEKTARPIVETHAENRTEIDEKETKRYTSKDDQKEINGERKVIKVEKKEFHNDIEGHSTGNQMKEIEGQHISDHNVSSSSSDSDSESSSDTPMIGVMPVLDELHPLIESAAPPLHTLVPQEDSDVHESDDGSADLVGEVENAEEEEEAREKAVVKWTEDDEKNLKEVGSSEIERNQRLENLIAKRMARKRWMVEAEKNLIDFDANDGMPINIPSVSTIRLNPFDPPYDLDEIVGLPVPGSAPSVLLPRLNPFETPYDRAFERSNVVGEDPSQEEFTTPQQKDMFFRRYESFTLGAPFLGEMKPEKLDFKYRPYFIPENVASGGLGYGTTFQRQSSERSDSKVSSIPETDTPTASVSSNRDSEDQKDLLEQDFHNVDESNYVSNNSPPRVETDIQSSKETDSDETNSDTSVVSGKTPQASGDVEETQNADAFDGIKVNTGDGGQEIVDNEEIVETPQDADAFDGMTVNAGNGRDEVVGNSKIVESPQDADKFDGMKVNTGNGREEVVNNSKIVETPADTDAFNGVKEKNVIGREATVNNGEVEAPVYDSSPSAIENLASISENLFDVHQGTRNSTEAHAENSEEGLPPKPTLVERSILHEDRESISNDGNEEKDMASNNEVVMQATPPSLSGVDEEESESRGDGEISEHDNTVQVGLIPEVVGQASQDNTLPDKTSLVSKTEEDEKVIHQDMHVGGPEFNTNKASAEGNHEESQDPTSAQSNTVEKIVEQDPTSAKSNTVEKTNVDNAKSELDVSS